MLSAHTEATSARERSAVSQAILVPGQETLALRITLGEAILDLGSAQPVRVQPLLSRVHQQAETTAHRPLGWPAHALGRPPSLSFVSALGLRAQIVFILGANGGRLLIGDERLRRGKPSGRTTSVALSSCRLSVINAGAPCCLPSSSLLLAPLFSARGGVSRLLRNARARVRARALPPSHTNMYGRRGA